MPDPSLSQADLEAVASAIAIADGYDPNAHPPESWPQWMQRYRTLARAAFESPVLSAPEGERWGVEERPDWMPPVEQQPDQVEAVAEKLRAFSTMVPTRFVDGLEALAAEVSALSRSGSVGEDQRLTQALDKLMMVGVGYRVRPMPVEDYELVEAAILILRALAGSVGESDGGEGAEDE